MTSLNVTNPHVFRVHVTPGAAANNVILVPTPGVPGPPGPPGDGTPVFGEALTGTKDGVNTTFTTASDFRANSTAVYRNGLREVRGVGYTEANSNEIEFDEAPLTGDDIRVDYILQ